MERHLFQPRKLSSQRKKHVQGLEDQKRQDLSWEVKVTEGSLSTMQMEDTTDFAHNRPLVHRAYLGKDIGKADLSDELTGVICQVYRISWSQTLQ